MIEVKVILAVMKLLHTKAVAKKAQKKSHEALMGFEPMTSAIPV